MDILPEELILQLIKDFDIKNLLSFRMICKRFSIIGLHEHIWERILKHQYSHAIIKGSAYITYCHYSTPTWIMTIVNGVATTTYVEHNLQKLLSQKLQRIPTSILSHIMKTSIHVSSGDYIYNDENCHREYLDVYVKYLIEKIHYRLERGYNATIIDSNVNGAHTKYDVIIAKI